VSITVATTATTLDAATVAALDIVDNKGPSPVVLSAGITVLPGQSRQVLVAAGTPLTATVPSGHPSSTVNITVQPGWPSDGHLQVASQIASDPTAAATLAGSSAFTNTYGPGGTAGNVGKLRVPADTAALMLNPGSSAWPVMAVPPSVASTTASNLSGTTRTVRLTPAVPPGP